MILFLISQTFSGTTADLVPPFVSEHDEELGYWEFSGSAVILDDRVRLAPPVQYNKGATWTNVEIPSPPFSIQYDLQISEGSGGGGFGFWFTDKYGDSGVIHGGPSVFKGIAILGTVFTDEEGSKTLRFHFIENDGKKKIILEELGQANYILPFKPQDHITIKLHFTQKSITVSANLQGTMTELFSQTFTVVISENYIGITAQSDAYTSLIELYSILFSIDEEDTEKPTKKRTDTFGANIPSGHYIPNHQSILRHPAFHKTLSEISKLNQISKQFPESDLSTLFDVIDEINTVSFDVASFKELNNFVRTELIPYTSKWHKRTLKMVSEVQNARNVAGAAFNYSHQIMNTFQSTIKHGVLKANLKIINLTKVMVETFDEAPPILDNVSKSSYRWMTITGIIELIVFILVFLIIQIPAIKRKILNQY